VTVMPDPRVLSGEELAAIEKSAARGYFNIGSAATDVRALLAHIAAWESRATALEEFGQERAARAVVLERQVAEARTLVNEDGDASALLHELEAARAATIADRVTIDRLRQRAEDVEGQRRYWEEEARSYAQNADYWRRRAEEAERQRDALREALTKEHALQPCVVNRRGTCSICALLAPKEGT